MIKNLNCIFFDFLTNKPSKGAAGISEVSTPQVPIEGWFVGTGGFIFCFYYLLIFRLLSGFSVLRVFSDHVFYSVQTARECIFYSQ